ncbi:MAG TPA: DUF305 domain-containing protein, partial [Chitinophagaceae bacterium]
MKKLMAIAAIVGLVSCGNDQSDKGQAAEDTTSQAVPGGASTAASGRSMMAIMQDNLNQMKQVESTGNPDNDFAALMKVHHMGAVEMAQEELAAGTDPEIKQMAEQMISEQQKEIAELNTFLSGHQAHGGGDAFYKAVMSQMNDMKMDMHDSGSVDRQFVQMMIPHHQHAIDMSKKYLSTGAHEPKMKEMANKMIKDQQQEINDMKAWLEK